MTVKPINHFPRNFCYIRGTIQINTAETIPGDVLHITRNNSGLLGYNPRTNRYFYVDWSILRNPEDFTVSEILK